MAANSEAVKIRTDGLFLDADSVFDTESRIWPSDHKAVKTENIPVTDRYIVTYKMSYYEN